MCANAQTRVPLVAAEDAPRKRSTGGRDSVREAAVSSADLRIGTWNFGELSNVTIRLCKNSAFWHYQERPDGSRAMQYGGGDPLLPVNHRIDIA